METVLDASVALKWQFEDEEATNQAMVLLEDFIDDKISLISLTLFPYEIISAINVAINRQRIRETDGFKAITYITSLGIELRRFDDLVEATFRMARRYGLSPYDCAYIALAERENCNFYTGDKKLFTLVNKYLPRVKWIGNYK